MESLFTIVWQKVKLFFVLKLKLLMKKKFITQFFDRHIENLQGEFKEFLREFSLI
jgi:hypothetical protein